jgi:hypothetical protein
MLDIAYRHSGAALCHCKDMPFLQLVTRQETRRGRGQKAVAIGARLLPANYESRSMFGYA